MSSCGLGSGTGRAPQPAFRQRQRVSAAVVPPGAATAPARRRCSREGFGSALSQPDGEVQRLRVSVVVSPAAKLGSGSSGRAARHRCPPGVVPSREATAPVGHRCRPGRTDAHLVLLRPGKLLQRGGSAAALHRPAGGHRIPASARRPHHPSSHDKHDRHAAKPPYFEIITKRAECACPSVPGRCDAAPNLRRAPARTTHRIRDPRPRESKLTMVAGGRIACI